jgi:hypothetical protein
LDISTVEPEGVADHKSQDGLHGSVGMSGAVRETAGYVRYSWPATGKSDRLCYEYTQTENTKRGQVACSEQVFPANVLRTDSNNSYSTIKSYAFAVLIFSSDYFLVCGQRSQVRGQFRVPASVSHQDKQRPTRTGKNCDGTQNR